MFLTIILFLYPLKDIKTYVTSLLSIILSRRQPQRIVRLITII